MTARELSRRRVLETVPLICFGGCTAPRSSQRFAGHYSWGFEASVFAPCDRAERWWVVNDHELYNRYQTVAENDYEQVYAEVRGSSASAAPTATVVSILGNSKSPTYGWSG